MRTKRWKIQLLVLLAYTLFALILTWPVVTHFDSHVPGNGVDDPPLTWNLWWVRTSLLRLGTNPFESDYLFYPLGINLGFYTLTVLNGLLSIPLQGVLGLIPATNLLLLSSFILSAYGAFLLASYFLFAGPHPRANPSSDSQFSNFLRPLLVPFTAGLLYSFASSKLAYAALGQWNIASSQWIPFFVLYLFKMGENPYRWHYPLLATLFFLFQAYAELTYATFLILFTALWTIWHVWTRLRSACLWRRVGNLVLVGCTSLLGLIPILAMMIPDMLVEGDIFVESGGFADVFSADLIGFLVPSVYHPILGNLVEYFRFDYSVGQHLYLGYSVLALAVLGIIFARRRTLPVELRAPTKRRAHPADFWILSAIVFWLLSLGPTLRINGHDTGLPLPFALVARLPFFKGNRYPSRYSVMLFLCLAILVAYGMASLLQRRREDSFGILRSVAVRLIPLLLVTGLLFEHLAIPLPLSDMRVPGVYEMIADEMPGDSTLLDLPVAWRNGFRVTGTQHPIIMFEQYYQSVHGRRILAGNTSRNPPLKFQYFTEAPVINTLIALETGHQVDAAVIERDRMLAADVLRFFDIGALVVHPAQSGPDMVPYLETTFPVKQFYDDEETVAYWVDLPPWPEHWLVQPGDDLGRLSYAEGWGIPAHDLNWAQRSASRLLVPLNGTEQEMTFQAYTPRGGQQLGMKINGQVLEPLVMSAGWMDYEVNIPASLVHKGLNEIWLHFETLYPASHVRLSPRSIGATGFESPVNLVVQSAGQEVGDFGHIYVNGQYVSPNQRGYNIAVLHAETGDVEQIAAFDTHLDEGASQALASFLTSIPSERIVAVVAADDASRLLNQEAVAALQGIGATGDLRGRFRWGHAIIGIRGASPGTALETMDWMRPVALVVGEGATEPSLAAAFATIRFTARSHH